LSGCCRTHEKYTSLLHFIISQSAAAAQATALNLGANHTAALLIPLTDMPEIDHSLYTFGRGERHENVVAAAAQVLTCMVMITRVMPSLGLLL